MNAAKNIIFALLIISFLIFSFYPTIFELQRKDKLADSRREFILEHNYYWPDYNLYLSKIRQGLRDHLTAVEKYTSEIHKGSLIQEFYVVLGWLGKALNLSANNSYLLGRIILSPLLLLVIILLIKYYFKFFTWQILAFAVTVSSASFPRIFTDAQGVTHIGRFMEWWSNIDALQRITFIPHILFGQVVSFYLLYKLVISHSGLSRIVNTLSDSGVANAPQNDNRVIFNKQLIFYILLGNLVGLAFPPSLITLITVLLMTLILKNFAGRIMLFEPFASLRVNTLLFREACPEERSDEWVRKKAMSDLSKILFIIFTLPSLLYIFFITKHLPWSALVDFHRTHPMMIPFDQYILGTGPIFFLGFLGTIVSIIKRDRKFQPLIFWILATFAFAAIFSQVKEQSPLRFTQTGLFIPLGILGSYFFYQLFHLSDSSYLSHLNDLGRRTVKTLLALFFAVYLLTNLFMMKTSLDWQTTWITQRIEANIPLVPYPPQAMYPLREWMNGIRWLKNNTEQSEVVLAEITAANYIPAYAGNTVYWGQSNTVDYDRKEKEVDSFFTGKMTPIQAELFLKNGRVKYIFFSIQEKDLPAGEAGLSAGEAGKAGGKDLVNFYPFVRSVYSNNILTIYEFRIN